MNMQEWENRLQQHAAAVKDHMAAPFPSEKEEIQMFHNIHANDESKTRSGKRKVLIFALAACLLLSTTAFAAGGYIAGWFSGSLKEYEVLPSPEQFVEDVGYEPVLLERFANGFVYEKGNVTNTDVVDEDKGPVESFRSATFSYGRDGETVYFSQEKFKSELVEIGEVIEVLDGVELRYSSYVNTIVPADYQLSEAEKEAEARGEVVFTYGSDTVQTMEVKSLQWVVGDIHYMLMQMGGSLHAEDLVDMAKEILAE